MKNQGSNQDSNLSSVAAGFRGALTGALWRLGEHESSAFEQDLRYFSRPESFGKFLEGLFCLARKSCSEDPRVISEIDRLILAYETDEFLEAIPSLRLAFSFFTPREKNKIASTLLQATESKAVPSLILRTSTLIQPQESYNWNR